MKRFVYAYSHVYGWAVYDRNRGMTPAYEACAEVLPPAKVEEDGTILSRSPVNLPDEWTAFNLAVQLNGKYRKTLRK